MNFRYLLDFRDIFRRYDLRNEMSIWHIALSAEEEMRKVERLTHEFAPHEFEEIRLGFASLAREYRGTEEHFDDLISRLYDWCDRRLEDGTKFCWVRMI